MSNGLCVKYIVFKVMDGCVVDNCFVLRPDKDPAAVEALRAYAVATENKELSADILAWVGSPQPLTLDELRSMGGEPVYIVEHDADISGHAGHWELSESAEDYFDDRDETFYGLACSGKKDGWCKQEGCKNGLHLMGWLAYRTKPEGIESK